MKTAVLKILHAYMYDPFYEFPKERIEVKFDIK